MRRLDLTIALLVLLVASTCMIALATFLVKIDNKQKAYNLEQDQRTTFENKVKDLKAEIRCKDHEGVFERDMNMLICMDGTKTFIYSTTTSPAIAELYKQEKIRRGK